MREAATRGLAPDYAFIQPPKEDTPHHDTKIENVRSVQLEDGQAGFEVSFVITGGYEVRFRYADDAEADCRQNLRLNLTHVLDAIRDSVSFTITDINGDIVY